MDEMNENDHENSWNVLEGNNFIYNQDLRTKKKSKRWCKVKERKW